jgi:hypothetical protein
LQLYVSVTNRTGSARASSLAELLSAWHDEMVVHARALARSSEAACDESCPHARSIELWRTAQEVLGADADRLIFLRKTAMASPDGRSAERAWRAVERENRGAPSAVSASQEGL